MFTDNTPRFFPRICSIAIFSSSDVMLLVCFNMISWDDANIFLSKLGSVSMPGGQRDNFDWAQDHVAVPFWLQSSEAAQRRSLA